MKVTLSKKSTKKTLIKFVTSKESKNILDFSGEVGEITTRYDNNTTTIYCGLGDEIKSSQIRSASANALRNVIKLKRKNVSLISNNNFDLDNTKAMLAGAILGTYTFEEFKTGKKSTTISAIELVDNTISAKQVKEITAITSGVFYARDLVNKNAHEITPDKLAKEAIKLSKDKTIKVSVLTEKEIKSKGLGLLYAVGQGSPFPPRLIIMEYNGDKKSKKNTAIIGKGITFDSGGQNLKPGGHIETMRSDMAGAASVLGLMKVVSALKPKINLTCVVSSAHNAIGTKAYFPGDVYKSYAGKTVEITNTDAEGRLVLSDAISYTVKNYKPSQIIDIATLTGGVLIALGDTIAGLFSNNDDLAKKLYDAGEKTNERLWQLPLYEEHKKLMESDLADLRNTSKGPRGYASSITGAAFLKEFVENIPWAHIDIAGTAFNEGESKGEIPKFGTGFGVRLFWNYLTA